MLVDKLTSSQCCNKKPVVKSVRSLDLNSIETVTFTRNSIPKFFKNYSVLCWLQRLCELAVDCDPLKWLLQQKIYQDELLNYLFRIDVHLQHLKRRNPQLRNIVDNSEEFREIEKPPKDIEEMIRLK